MHRGPNAGRFLRHCVRVAFLVSLLFHASIAAAQPPDQDSEPAPTSPQTSLGGAPLEPTPPPGTSVLILVSLHADAGEEIAPWTHPADAQRFKPIEDDLAAKLAAGGYAVIAMKNAMGMEAVRSVLRTAPRPLTLDAAAGAARAAGATIALVIHAEVIRTREAAAKKNVRSDAVLDAHAVRAADGVRLASAHTRVTALGPGEAEADAEALRRAANPLFAAMEAPLAVAAARPVIPPHPLPLTIEGQLGWHDYRRLLDFLREEIPEIRSIQERRFSNGRFGLLAVCACNPGDLAERLGGKASGDLKLEAQVLGEGVVIRATRAGRP
jgi:hypothetical protein